MNEGQALVETQRELRDMESRAERAEHELNEWKRGDVGQANRLMADRCVNAEHIARDAVARAEKAEAAEHQLSLAVRDAIANTQEANGRCEKAEAALAAAETEHAEDLKFADRRQVNAVATARAVMAEEAAQKVDPPGYDTPIENRHVYERLAKSIRALAQLPAGLVVLPVEVVANARVELLEAHGRAERCECDKPCSTCATIAALDAAGGAT